MLQQGWQFRCRGVAWLLLLWFVVAVAVALAASVDLASPPGIFDDDDDDDSIIVALSNLDLKLVAPILSSPSHPPKTLGGPALVQTDHLAPVVPVFPTSSRSPPVS